MVSAPEMAGLLNWCPADGYGLQGIYNRDLPWDHRVKEAWGLTGEEQLDQDQSKIFPSRKKVSFSRERD